MKRSSSSKVCCLVSSALVNHSVLAKQSGNKWRFDQSCRWAFKPPYASCSCLTQRSHTYSVERDQEWQKANTNSCLESQISELFYCGPLLFLYVKSIGPRGIKRLTWRFDFSLHALLVEHHKLQASFNFHLLIRPKKSKTSVKYVSSFLHAASNTSVMKFSRSTHFNAPHVSEISPCSFVTPCPIALRSGGTDQYFW